MLGLLQYKCPRNYKLCLLIDTLSAELSAMLIVAWQRQGKAIDSFWQDGDVIKD